MYSVGVVSLGCSKNRVDTELMLGILRKAGYRITADEREADILIVNTCGFIEPAKQESIDTLLSLARYKQEGKLKLLAATGCLTQRYEQAILQDMPEVDLVLGVSQYPMLPRAIEEALAGKRPSYCAPEPTVLCGERVLTTAPYTAYVRIADGCVEQDGFALAYDQNAVRRHGTVALDLIDGRVEIDAFGKALDGYVVSDVDASERAGRCRRREQQCKEERSECGHVFGHDDRLYFGSKDTISGAVSIHRLPVAGGCEVQQRQQEVGKTFPEGGFHGAQDWGFFEI